MNRMAPEAILAQDPQHRPKKLNRSPAPFVHAATKAARQALYQSYSWFVGELRTSSLVPILGTLQCCRSWPERCNKSLSSRAYKEVQK